MLDLKTLITSTLLLVSLSVIPQNNYQLESSKSTKAISELPTGYNDIFAGSGVCLPCHNDMINAQGNSVSILSDWRSTMMANSSKDPFWRAKVSHEILVNPVHKEALEDVCTRCHATAGNENAHYLGQQFYTIEQMENDPLALDGVQCTVCHQIKEESLGNFSGNFDIGNNHIIWGPFENPFTNPMIMETGYTPTYSNHINNSKLCGSCHTLITNSVDNNGIPTGNKFVEQAVFHEWLNSAFADEGTTCQNCHVPRINDPVKVSSRPPWLDPRTPFGMHHFSGANSYMVGILKENIQNLGITASETHLDSTISRNNKLLQSNTLQTILNVQNRTADTIFLEFVLKNKAGHKLPTGYPSRRVFIELIVTDNNDTVFHSGEFDSSGNLLSENTSFESHYNFINSEDQVQIYEYVMGDINYDVTTVLERANFPLKDNRLPPEGFISTHNSYDTVPIIGLALSDPNFNRLNNIEGTGEDIVYYNVPTMGNYNDLRIISRVFYQTINPGWLSEMFNYSSDEINAFKEYYNNADNNPVLISSNELISIYSGIEENADLIKIYPNPSCGSLSIESNRNIKSITVYNSSGRVIDNIKSYNSSKNIEINLPDTKGLFFIQVNSTDSKTIHKIVNI